MPDRQSAMRKYWDDNIKQWSLSSYEGEKVQGPISKFMSKLRGSVNARAEIAAEILKSRIEGKTLLDLGCGYGGFALDLLEVGAERVIGWDISPEAIAIANDLAKQRGLSDRATFEARTVESGEFPETDFTTGLGLLDWMPPDEIQKLLAAMSGRQVMFSFSEQDNTFAEIVHRIWLCKWLEWFGGGVRAYHHKRETIYGWFEAAGFDRDKLTIIAKPEARFGRLIHNFD